MTKAAALRRAIWVVVAGAIAALVLVGGVSLSQAISIRDAELVAGENAPVTGNEATVNAADRPESASTEGFVCGYVECEVELTVIKTAKTTIKGAPGGLVQYNFEVQVPTGAPGPVFIDSVVDDAFGDLDLSQCNLVGVEIDPGDADDCSLDALLPVLAAGDSHTNTVTVTGYVVDTDIPASGQDSLTINIVEPLLDIEATYTVLTGTFNKCIAEESTDLLGVDGGSTFYHCIGTTNTGSTAIVSVQVTSPGPSGTFTRLRMPGTNLYSNYSAATAQPGTRWYTFEIEATDEWGDTITVIVFTGVIFK